ncbi:MAG: (2Fe-2S) ferredoxin domain-containing protein [Bacteroidales bacterium]
MGKIKTLTDLRKIREEHSSGNNLGHKGVDAEKMVHVKVAMASCGIASGAKETMIFMHEQLAKRGVEAVVTKTGCMGYCYAEPTIEVRLPGNDPVVFGDVDTGKADEIIEKYIKAGELVNGIIPENYETIDFNS